MTTTFPTGFSDLASVTGSTKLLADDGANNGLVSVDQIKAAAGLATSTTAGRLARYTDTAGAQGQTAGIFEGATGNVGIGTSAPASKLHVFGGDLTLGGSGDAALRTLQLQSMSGFPTAHVGIETGPSALRLYGWGGIYLDSAQSTVNFTTPNSKTATWPVYNSRNFTFQGHTNGGEVIMANVDGSEYFHAYLGGTAGQKITFPTGNVGIGTTSPRVKCDVNGPLAVGSYTVATVPSAAVAAGQIIYVSNEAGGACLAFSDGANWRRPSDRAIIS